MISATVIGQTAAPETMTKRPTLDERTTEEIDALINHFDPVDKPIHYNQGGIECIDYIKQQLGEDFYAYCWGNAIKYLHRWKYKNGREDLKKAQVYLTWLLENVDD